MHLLNRTLYPRQASMKSRYKKPMLQKSQRILVYNIALCSNHRFKPLLLLFLLVWLFFTLTVVMRSLRSFGMPCLFFSCYFGRNDGGYLFPDLPFQAGAYFSHGEWIQILFLNVLSSFRPVVARKPTLELRKILAGKPIHAERYRKCHDNGSK